MEDDGNNNESNFKLKGPRGWAHGIKNKIKGAFKNFSNAAKDGKKKMFIAVLGKLLLVFKIALPVILIFAAAYYVITTDLHASLISSVDSFFYGSTTVSAEAKSTFEKSGSLILVNNDDIKNISDSFLNSLMRRNNSLYEALSNEDSIGDHKFSKLDYTKGFDIKNAYEFILNAERMNFNRASWKKVDRENGKISDLAVKKDDDTNLKYPDYEDDTTTEKNATYFAKMLRPYLQSYVIPSSMMSGISTKGDNANIANFAFQIIDKGYHTIDVLQYTLQSASRDQTKRHTVSVEQEVTIWTRSVTVSDGVDENGNPKTKTVTYHRYSRTDLDKGVAKAKELYSQKHATEAENIVITGTTDAEIKKELVYPVIKADTLKKFMRAEYEQIKYSDEDVKNLVNSKTQYVVGTNEYKEVPKPQGSPVSNPPSGGDWSESTTTVNITYGEDITTRYTWSDELEEQYIEERDYQIDDISEFINETDKIVKNEEVELTEEEKEPGNRPDLRLKAADLFSASEINYYKDLEKNVDITRIDLINAVPSIYKDYLTLDEKYSDYIGYSRAYLSMSYSILNKHIKTETLSINYNKLKQQALGIDIIMGSITGLDMIWPISSYGSISSGFGLPRPELGQDYGHNGIDITYTVNDGPYPDKPYAGSYVMAASSGKVVEVFKEKPRDQGNSNSKCPDTAQGANYTCGGESSYGRHVVIESEETGYTTLYGHLYEVADGIEEGTYVQQGQVIGVMGTTGSSTGVHLHFEVRKAPGRYSDGIDPMTVESLMLAREYIKTGGISSGGNTSTSDHDEIDRKIDAMNDVELLARLIYSEQGANSEESRVLVGISVLNRAKNSSIKTVAKSKYNGTNGKTFYQYNGVENANFWGNIPDYSMEDARKAIDIVNNKGTYKVNGVECINVEGFKASNDKASLGETWNRWSRKVILENTKSGAKYTGYYGI